MVNTIVDRRARSLWLLWVLASALGWGLGLWLARVVAGIMSAMMSDLAVLGAVGGLVSGGAQWLVLRRRLLRAGWWIPASALGGLVGSSLGLGTLMIGPAAGIAQWLVLQFYSWQAGRWVLVSVVGWLVGWTATIIIGMLVPVILSERMPLDTGSLVAGAISGAVYGSIAGYRLARLLRAPLADA